MEPIVVFYALFAITLLFGVMLVARRWVPFRICAICLSVSLVWISLLVLYRLGVVQDMAMIALLMGQSILGVYYLVEKHVPKKLTLFRLPFLLSLTIVAYMLITWSLPVWAIVFNVVVWAGLAVIYAYRNNSKLSVSVNSLIECCSRW